jgi:hypothetical protein
MHLYLEIQTANKIWLSLTRTISRLLYWKHRISYIDGEIIDILMNVVARLEALFLISLCVSSHLAKCPSLHRNTKFSAIAYAEGKVGRSFSQVESTTHKAHIRSLQAFSGKFIAFCSK